MESERQIHHPKWRRWNPDRIPNFPTASFYLETLNNVSTRITAQGHIRVVFVAEGSFPVQPGIRA